MRGLSLVVASGGHSSLRCAGLSLSRPLLLRSAGSVVVAHGPSRSAACGIFPDQGSNLCPLHWQADSQPLRHQGSPHGLVLYLVIKLLERMSLPGTLPQSPLLQAPITTPHVFMISLTFIFSTVQWCHQLLLLVTPTSIYTGFTQLTKNM